MNTRKRKWFLGAKDWKCGNVFVKPPPFQNQQYPLNNSRQPQYTGGQSDLAAMQPSIEPQTTHPLNSLRNTSSHGTLHEKMQQMNIPSLNEQQISWECFGKFNKLDLFREFLDWKAPFCVMQMWNQFYIASCLLKLNPWSHCPFSFFHNNVLSEFQPFCIMCTN